MTQAETRLQPSRSGVDDRWCCFRPQPASLVPACNGQSARRTWCPQSLLSAGAASRSRRRARRWKRDLEVRALCKRALRCLPGLHLLCTGLAPQQRLQLAVVLRAGLAVSGCQDRECERWSAPARRRASSRAPTFEHTAALASAPARRCQGLPAPGRACCRDPGCVSSCGLGSGLASRGRNRRGQQGRSGRRA